VVLASILAVAMTACAGGSDPSASDDPEPGAAAAAEEREPDPVPSHAWLLDGDGQPAAGGVVLTFDGTVELADGAAVFDGASGFASTRAPGPIDTTASFSVAAWVSLHPPTDAGGWGFNTVVSQLGDVAADFGLGVAYGRWNFWMKDADTNEPGHTFRASATIADPDPGAWVQGRRGGSPHRRHATRHATALPNGTHGYTFTSNGFVSTRRSPSTLYRPPSPQGGPFSGKATPSKVKNCCQVPSSNRNEVVTSPSSPPAAAASAAESPDSTTSFSSSDVVYRWSLDGDTLSLALLEGYDPEERDMVALIPEHDYSRVAP
jgi:hypothetical protein